jgi:hypothetical protein
MTLGSPLVSSGFVGCHGAGRSAPANPALPPREPHKDYAYDSGAGAGVDKQGIVGSRE